MAEPGNTRRIGIGLVGLLVLIVVGWRLGAKRDGGEPESTETATAGKGSAAVPASPRIPERPGLSAPIAAAHGDHGEVVVAGLDVVAKAVRVQRFDASDRILADRTVLDGLAWSNDSDLRLAAHPTEGVTITWRGLRGGKLVRQLVVLGADLAPKGEPSDVGATSCATREAVWLSDGAHAVSRPWRGPPAKVALPADEDASLFCGPKRAFAVLEGEERIALVPLGEGEPKPAPLTVLRESDFGDDEQRDVSEYAVGEDVGVVRIGGSGSVAVREIAGGSLGVLHKLKTSIPKDDDIVAVDASSKVLVIVYTQDASASCTGSMVVSTKVTALRVDRQTFEESTVEISPGRCGNEVGPFFTGVVGDSVSVAWPERTGGVGRARAPIVGLAHALVAPTGAAPVAFIAAPADALVDAGCDGSRCYAAALARTEDADAAAPGSVRVLRYNGK